MELKKIPYELTVCKLKNVKDIDLNEGFYFVGCLVEKKSKSVRWNMFTLSWNIHGDSE